MTFLLNPKSEVDQAEINSKVAQDIAHIRGKIDMLNDWHEEVNEWRSKIDEWRNKMDGWQIAIQTDLKWISRITAATALFAAVDKLNLIEVLSKMIGG